MDVLLVGQADSIFFEHYTKKIKNKRPDINFDVFALDPLNGKYDLSACNIIYVNKWCNSRFRKIKILRTILQPLITWFSLFTFLKQNKNKYDIIHFKWLVPSVILFPKIIKRFTKKTIATFWGSEIESQKIFFSNGMYLFFLKLFLKECDIIANRSQKIENYVKYELNSESKFYKAHYGSSIIEEIQNLSNSETKRKSKNILGIEDTLITIAIGYSGKTLHQHLLIINELFKSEELSSLKDNFHFILPFSYGCNSVYSDTVENELKMYTDKYTIIKPGKYSDIEIARMRNATDVLIQLSKSDGLSASIIESFYAGSIIITGKWLAYSEFKKAQLHFYELDAIDETLPNLIIKIKNNFQSEMNLCLQNKSKWNYDSWEEVIPTWISIYDVILQQ